MGLFSLLNDLTDPEKLTGAIDRVEQTLNQTLDKAEDSLQSATDAMQKLDSVAQLAEEKIPLPGDSARSIDTIKPAE